MHRTHIFGCSQLYIYIYIYVCVCVYIYTYTIECHYYYYGLSPHFAPTEFISHMQPLHFCVSKFCTFWPSNNILYKIHGHIHNHNHNVPNFTDLDISSFILQLSRYLSSSHGWQIAPFSCHIMACLALMYFSWLSRKRHIFIKRVT